MVAPRLISRIRSRAQRAPTIRPARAGTRLLWEADPILVLVTRLRATSFVTDLARLRTGIVRMLQDFQERARTGIEASRVAQATEVLCALIDHVVTSMPWGADADWKSLGRSRSSSGRRPAERMLEMARAAASDCGMSELVCVALGLGFDTRSRGPDDAQIEQALARLTKLHSQQVGAAGLRLSPEVQPAIAHRQAWTSWLPLWVSSLVIAALLAVLFFILSLSLGATSDRLYARIAALTSAAASPQRPQLAATPRLAGALANEVTARDLFVRDEIDRSVIVVPDAKLFEPGTPTLRPESTALLRAIAAASIRARGRIQVIGHTDGIVARSARYPSDWDLSVDRARAVQAALRDLGVEGSRIAYDGRANVEPLKADDPARSISSDGRVEILLLAGR